MKKILYVEDELDIDIIIEIFEGLIDDKLIEILTELKNDEYGASNKDIKELFDSNFLIDVEYSFEGALKRVESLNEYSLFIFDRNLHNLPGKKSFENIIIEQFPSFREKNEMLNKFMYEGDFLLELLSRRGATLSNCYFLTANSKEDQIPPDNIISEIIAFNAFHKTNILDKEDPNDRHKLKLKITKFKHDNIFAQMSDVFEAFTPEFLGQAPKDTMELKRSFIDILSECGKAEKTRKVLRELRVMLETIFKILHRINGENCVSAKFAKYEGQKQDTSFYSALELLVQNDYLERDKFLYKILRNIWDVSTGEGNHNKIGDRAKRNPTKYTAETYIYAMADILLWAKEIIKTKKK